MRQLLKVSLVLLLVGGMIVAAEPIQTNLATITVVVRRAGTSEPIAGVMVTVSRFSGGGQKDLRAMSDEKGRVVFKDLLPGQYGVRAEREGYGVTESASLRRSNEARGFVDPVDAIVPNFEGNVTTRADTPGAIEIPLIPVGSAFGRVVNDLGEPIPNCEVLAFRVTYLRGEPRLSQSVWAPTSLIEQSFGPAVKATAPSTPFSAQAFREALEQGAAGPVFSRGRSNDQGEFGLQGLQAGTYYFRASPPQSLRPTRLQAGYPLTYYPNFSDLNRAIPITISGSQRVRADIRIDSTKLILRKVSGTVVALPSAGLDPMPEVKAFYLIPRNANPGLPEDIQPTSNRALDKSEGRFEIEVPPGAYDLFPAVQVVSPRPTTPIPLALRLRTSPTPIEVGEEDLSDIRAEIRPYAVLSGRIAGDAPGGGCPRDGCFKIRLSETGPRWLALPEGSNRVLSSNNSFEFSGLAETRYRVSIEIPSDLYVSALRLGEKDIYDTGEVVIGKDPVAPLTVSVVSGSATVQGTVQYRSQALANAVVVMAPMTSGSRNPDAYRSATSDSNGQFTIRGLAPGAYRLLSWQELPSGAEHSPQFVDRYLSYGRGITVQRGERLASVVVQAIPRDEVAR